MAADGEIGSTGCKVVVLMDLVSAIAGVSKTDSGHVRQTGGGITIDSVPEDEWYETEIKTGTLLSVIHDIQ